MSKSARTILIVDDDPQIPLLLTRMLRPKGVNVLTAHRPSEAIRICESQSIDVLISDVYMPEMDGPRLADRILKLNPQTQILLISGQARSAGHKNPRIKFLRKPFFPAALIDALRELLPEL